jgi:hypothetical protein
MGGNRLLEVAAAQCVRKRLSAGRGEVDYDDS